jgi:hypothetical protein
MEAQITQTGTRPRATARHPGFRRFAVAVAALACALVTPATVIPAAWAKNVIPDYDGPAQAPAVYAAGMPGWQITLITIASALVAAVAAVLIDRTRTATRAARSTT